VRERDELLLARGARVRERWLRVSLGASAAASSPAADRIGPALGGWAIVGVAAAYGFVRLLLAVERPSCRASIRSRSTAASRSSRW
jgi:hypothetical protein